MCAPTVPSPVSLVLTCRGRQGHPPAAVYSYWVLASYGSGPGAEERGGEEGGKTCSELPNEELST